MSVPVEKRFLLTSSSPFTVSVCPFVATAQVHACVRHGLTIVAVLCV
jgi:hypothetical protein